MRRATFTAGVRRKILVQALLADAYREERYEPLSSANRAPWLLSTTRLAMNVFAKSDQVDLELCRNPDGFDEAAGLPLPLCCPSIS